MRLNGIKPADGAKKDRKRVGRGASSGHGKTAGRGMKGQKSRSGGYHKVGFEGGQMPLQRRLPKIGFKSRKGLVTDEVRLDELAKVEGDTVDLAALKGAGVVRQSVQYVKVFASGELTRKLDVRGLKLTKGARAAIEAAGGSVEE